MSVESHTLVCVEGTPFVSHVLGTRRSQLLYPGVYLMPVQRVVLRNSQLFPTSKMSLLFSASLCVLCTNSKTGCDWIGEVGDITGHLTKASGCKYEVVGCPNSCGKTFEQQYLANHVEKECPRHPSKCQYCYTEGNTNLFRAHTSSSATNFLFPVPITVR